MSRSSFGVSLVALALFILASAPAALAGHTPVDPTSLSPEPPAGATCWSTGTAVRCDTFFDNSYANEPAFELPCGVVYASSQDIRTVTRWYEDGLLVRRAVHQTAEGSWSLSPTGAGPVVTVVSHTGWGEIYTIPGDLSSAVGSQQGTDLLAMAAKGGVVAHISGQTHGEAGFTGRFLWFEDPADPAIHADVAASICAALTA